MNPDVKALIGERGKVKASLTRFKTYFESYDQSSNTAALRVRLEKALPLFEKFDSVQSSIDEKVVGTDLEGLQANEREEFEKAFGEIIGAAEDFIAQRRPQTPSNVAYFTPSSTPSPSTSAAFEKPRIKLPTIELPAFDGTYSHWIKFKDTFESLIHNNDALSNIEKFHYLNSALKGSAARVILSLGVSEVNYALAWKALNDRFEDKKTLRHNHIRALWNVQILTKDSFSGLRRLLDDVNNNLLALKALGEPTDKWDSLIIYLLTTKLDSVTRQDWERHQSNIRKDIILKDMMDFLENHCRYLEKITSDRSGPAAKPQPKSNSGNSRTRDQVAAYTTNSQASCLMCKGSHFLTQCDEFKKLSPAARISQIQQARACFNCLGIGHRNRDCTRTTCKICNRRHHILLHIDQAAKQPNSSVVTTTTPSISDSESSRTDVNKIVNASVSCVAQSKCSSQITLLSTALVYLMDCRGFRHECRVLLDSGSQSHFVSEELVRRLGLPCTDSDIVVTGIGGLRHGVHRKTSVELISMFNGFHRKLSCLVLPKITGNLLSTSLNPIDMSIPSGFKLADPQFHKSNEIHMIIGAGLFWDLQCIGRHYLGPNKPFLQKTQLGWIIAGNISLPLDTVKSQTACHLVTNEQLHSQIERFWEIEQISGKSSVLKGDYVEEHFLRNTIQEEDGRFMVKIPWKETITKLGNSRDQAMKRLFSLERKFNRQPNLKHKYVEFMQEYQTLGHMTEIVTDERDNERLSYYLPHHAVFKETSTTTKLRVVFDGSAKTTSGLSINDVQMIGPVVQDDLFPILIRFRIHKYVLSADVEKMFRQILVSKDDRRFQRILWRTNSSEPIKTFELNTVTYGTASAPFLATRALRRTGELHATEHPIVSKIIIKDFYVDDLLTGTDSFSSARLIKDTLTKILDRTGFRLRKWATNDIRILREQKEHELDVEIKSDKDPKTLGLLWDTRKDNLHYTINLSQIHQITKRTILSDISKIFDPLGLLGPVIVLAKLILQQLWQLKLSWDESLPQDLHSHWVLFRDTLEGLNSIVIPRHALPQSRSVELHGFCDASERAYGACVYLRCWHESQWTVHLLCAKSRVAPLKQVSLPRLELCGAVLLAQLVNKVRDALECITLREFYWTDSMIVISWINSPSSRWKTFVANRTSEIQNLTKGTWSHVPSGENPADIISRGLNPSELQGCTLWWNGPTWLHQDTIHWPTTATLSVDVPEEKQNTFSLPVTKLHTWDMFTKFSTYIRLIRVVSLCLRFIRNIKSRVSRKNGQSDEPQSTSITTTELATATDILTKIAQEEYFGQEIHHLREGTDLPKNSSLRSLYPFLDQIGLIRVGGRLKNAPLDYGQRHPLVLPPRHRLTQLIIEHEHLRLLHAGCQTTIASLRTRYWLPTARRTVREILRKCIKCFRLKPRSMTQVMGDLPTARVTPSRPFYTCGVDYAGPFITKDRIRSKTTLKGYICVFVCFSTKAVHLELSVDMTTNAFLNCLKRFIARRGVCHSIYSDNGTNFVGARNEMNELFKALSNQTYLRGISDFLSSRQIQWHMIPPRAPHFGGLWESAVKSAKYHLRRVIGQTILTYEELYTVLTQVEAVLNSRPLCPLSTDPEDLTPLTPGHFLIGEALTCPPDHDLRDVTENRLTRFQLLQQKLQHFWQRWSREYLHQLQQRHKWRIVNPCKFGPGTLVVIMEDNLPPLQWRLGRIQDVHPGQDKLVRVVSIRTADGVVKRPMTKVCILPMQNDGNEGAATQASHHSHGDDNMD